MSNFKGRVIAITGAASGLGLSTAKLLFSLGASISISDRDEVKLEEAAECILQDHPDRESSGILAATFDVRSSDEVKSWIKATIDRFGKLDGAVNAAGITSPVMGKSATRDVTDEAWALCMDVNATGLFYCLREQIKAMTNGGSIVNIASVAGVAAVPGAADYVASKHAVVGLTVTAAKEEGRSNIRINAVAPGTIDTPMSQNVPKEFTVFLKDRLSKQPIPRIGRPEEVASTIAFLLGDESSFITGQVLKIDGGSSG